MAKSYSKNEKVATGVALLSMLIFIPVLSSTVTSGANTGGEFIPGQQELQNSLLGDPSVQYLSEDAVASFEVQDIVEGDGTTAEFGDTLYVHYVGQFENGNMFDTSTDSDEPFEFVLGQGDVIAGWEVGLVGMREGGTRRLVVPPAFGYGEAGVESETGEEIIPGDAMLVFDIMLLKVESAGE